MPTAYSARGIMKKVLFRTTVFTFVILSSFLNPLTVNTVEADYLKVIAPAEIYQSTSFEIEIEISDKPNTTFALKARFGSADKLNKGQTLSSTGVWLSDTVAWNRFPRVQTDADGHWSGKIMARANETAGLGQNTLVVRLGADDKFYKDSDPYAMTLLEDPKIVTTTPVEIGGQPILNEFLPSPSGGSEWVEIKNKGTGKIDLSGWLVDDEEGKSSPFTIPAGTIIGPNEFYVAHFSSAKLNDLTDSVRLLKPDGSLVEEYRYSDPEKGKSFAKDSTGAWFISSEPTPGSNNPNPPSVITTNNKTSGQPKVLGSETSESEGLTATLPKLGSSTSAKIATVSASYRDETKQSNLLSKLPLVVGGLLILSAFGIIGKRLYENYRLKKQSSG